MRVKLGIIRTVFIFLLTCSVASTSNAQCVYFVKMSVSGSVLSHVLAIKNDGTLWAWGNNNSYQVGNGSNTDVSIPTQIGTDNDWVEVAAGGGHSLALKSNGTLWAWGSNTYGQLGNGTNTTNTTPAQVGIATDWKSIAAGNLHSLVLKTDGTAWTWGNNLYCQLGQGSDCTHKNSPVQVGTATNWIMVAAGYYFSLGLQNNGTVWGWGEGSRGQLGNGNIDRNVPTAMAMGNWVYISAGNEHSVAIGNDGSAWAWGDNGYGQLGIGTTGSYKYAPVQIGTQTDWAVLYPGWHHTVGIRSNGTAWTWGTGDYALGAGTSGSSSPYQIGTDTDWESAFAGWDFGLAIKKNHSTWAWGRNLTGNLGDGTTTDVLLPKQTNPAPANPSPATANTIITKIQRHITDYHTTCTDLIARIEQMGSNVTMSGNITASVWVDAGQPTGSVKRHYEINPSISSGGAAKKITLYFRQQEFTDFNAVNTIKLPVDGTDAANNKANLLIEKYLGSSSDGSGLPGSYTGTSFNIDPADANIVWNAVDSRWEITFNAVGGGGYFVKTQTALIRPNTLDKVGLTYSTPGAVAYSLRLLSSNYTGAAMMVRRNSDNATQDIGFTVDGYLDTVALKNFVGAGNGYISRWYDQGGNNLHAEQANTSLQPLIVNGGLIERINRRPAVYFNATNLATPAAYIFTNAASMVGVAKGNSSTPSAFITKTGTAAGANPAYPGPFDFTNSGSEFTVGNAAITTYNFIQAGNSTPRSTVNNQVGESVYSFVIPSSGTYAVYLNGVQAGSNTVTALQDGGNSLRIGNRNDGSSTADFWTPEVILFNLSLSNTDRQMVETSLTNYYLSSSLPVRWVWFNGKVTNDNAARLSWQVNESNVTDYEVEKSSNGTTYSVIGQITSMGDGTHTYSFTDPRTLTGTCFYRIKQTDRDGRATRSIIIKLSNQSVSRIMIAPNPTQDLVTITVDNHLLNTPVSLYDVRGQKLQSFTITRLTFPVSLENYSGGVYFLKTADGIMRIIKK